MNSKIKAQIPFSATCGYMKPSCDSTFVIAEQAFALPSLKMVSTDVARLNTAAQACTTQRVKIYLKTIFLLNTTRELTCLLQVHMNVPDTVEIYINNNNSERHIKQKWNKI